jgi:hypothetical protein
MSADTAASRLFGPRRLILIQSGKYDYAELDLTRSFQLVGVNGLGKTALISTLQYLYLDNQRDMRFGQHSTDDSRRFYFKGDASFILFECETSLGTVTVGARSLGAVAGYELQRFAWTGAYDRADFIDEKNRPRAWDEVRATLATKELRVMADTAELRRLLGAVDDETNASWELVPLTDSRDYPRFRQTFQRLLQLKDIRQDDLKHLLADCAKLSPAEREIDLAKGSEKELTKINRDRVEVAVLRAAVARVKEARELYDQEYVARAIAHAATQEMQSRYAGYAAWFKSETNALYAVRDAAQKEFTRLEGEQKGLQHSLKEANQAAGGVKAKLDAIAEGRTRYADFVLEVEEQVRDRLSDEVAGLKMRLADVPKEAVEVLTRQLGEQQNQLAQRQATLAAIDQLFITWLRSRLPETDIARVGSLFDRRVLESKLDEQVTIRNEAELVRRLRGAAARCDPRGYEDDAVTVEFSAGAVSAVNQLGHRVRLEEEIRKLQREVDRLARDIETVKNAATYRARLPMAEKEFAAQLGRLNAYQRFREEIAKEATYESEFKRHEADGKKIEDLLVANESARNETKKSGDAAIEKFNRLQEEEGKIRIEARNLPSADGDNPGPTPLSTAFVRDLPESLLEVIRITRERCNQARSRGTQLAGTMSLLDKDFLTPSFRYDHAAPVVDRLSQLEAEIASLDERSQNIETRWTALLTDARSSFATMLKSLRAVTRQAQKLTGELGKIEFSSLTEVRLEIVPNAAAVSEYERHSKDSAQPSLFDTAEEADRKMTQFSQLLQRRPKLLLNELFSLRCDVRRKDGQRNSYDNFDEVESTGTTVVLKVTLNLLVLRDLLVPGKARIPYYLDEVHALDRQNFGNILQLSERLGFIGIYAAPTAAIGPRRFVHLVPDAKGRLVVTAAHRKDILRTPDDSTPPGEESHG